MSKIILFLTLKALLYSIAIHSYDPLYNTGVKGTP